VPDEDRLARFLFNVLEFTLRQQLELNTFFSNGDFGFQVRIATFCFC
jgi:hypothetical protein